MESTPIRTQVLKVETIARATSMVRGAERCWLAMHKQTLLTDGKEHGYYYITRGDKIVSPEEKRPDAVVVIAFNSDGTKMLVTDEYRSPIGRREYGSAAGLIDAKDYELPAFVLNGKTLDAVQSAACHAAVREVYEETGLTFVPVEVSPHNLYCTAGMTDESVCMVIGKVEGAPSKEFLEEHEDIDTMMLDRTEIIALMDRPEVAISKHVWPFYWMIKQFGFPKI